MGLRFDVRSILCGVSTHGGYRACPIEDLMHVPLAVQPQAITSLMYNDTACDFITHRIPQKHSTGHVKPGGFPGREDEEYQRIDS